MSGEKTFAKIIAAEVVIEIVIFVATPSGAEQRWLVWSR
jgi:hypothetical protein